MFKCEGRQKTRKGRNLYFYKHHYTVLGIMQNMNTINTITELINRIKILNVIILSFYFPPKEYVIIQYYF